MLCLTSTKIQTAAQIGVNKEVPSTTSYSLFIQEEMDRLIRTSLELTQKFLQLRTALLVLLMEDPIVYHRFRMITKFSDLVSLKDKNFYYAPTQNTL